MTALDLAAIVRMEPSRRGRRDRRRARRLVGASALLGGVLAVLAVAHAHRGFLLVNPTPSEPPGLYVRAAGAPIRVGSLIAFPAPPSAYPYADRRLSYLRETPILKAVVAVAGDEVCTLGGVLRIDGVRRAAVAVRDHEGSVLPRWIGCRRLELGEVFVFSDRVANSFDSRYFGPVRAAGATVYKPLFIATEPVDRRRS